MDITLLGASGFRIKNKTATVEINESITLINNQTEVKKEISHPGEYEVAGVSVMGYKNNIYVYEFEKLRLCSIGNLETPLFEDMVSEIGDIDVLIFSSVSKESVDLVSKIEPYFVIFPIENGLKDSGIPSEAMPKFSLKEEDIIEDQNTKVIVLEKK